jgi:hypothetical protein
MKIRVKTLWLVISIPVGIIFDRVSHYKGNFLGHSFQGTVACPRTRGALHGLDIRKAAVQRQKVGLGNILIPPDKDGLGGESSMTIREPQNCLMGTRHRSRCEESLPTLLLSPLVIGIYLP